VHVQINGFGLPYPDPRTLAARALRLLNNLNAWAKPNACEGSCGFAPSFLYRDPLCAGSPLKPAGKRVQKSHKHTSPPAHIVHRASSCLQDAASSSTVSRAELSSTLVCAETCTLNHGPKPPARIPSGSLKAWRPGIRLHWPWVAAGVMRGGVRLALCDPTHDPHPRICPSVGEQRRP